MGTENKVIKVSGSSPVKETAGSIVKCYMEDSIKDIELRAIGAGAVNQMYKSIATANSMFAQKGHSLTVRPGFADIEINNEKRTALVARLIIE